MPGKVRKIVQWPSQVLRRKSEPVALVDDKVRALLDDLVETMRAYNGVGLAAIQVGVPLRCFVIEADRGLEYFINPEVTPVTPGILNLQEGCLSVPGYFDTVKRWDRVKVKALGYNGETIEFEQSGLLRGHAIQHENDHLDGLVFVDYLSKSARKRAREAMAKG